LARAIRFPNSSTIGAAFADGSTFDSTCRANCGFNRTPPFSYIMKSAREKPWQEFERWRERNKAYVDQCVR
jgi:hypothetical protein